MIKGKMNYEVDAYLNTAKYRKEEMKALRKIVLDSGLTEELKWGKPCYTFEGKNIVIIQGFKAYCALLFFKGYLMDDPKGILVKTGAKTVIGRQIRFTDVEEITSKESILKKYIKEAIEVEKAELKKRLEKV